MSGGKYQKIFRRRGGDTDRHMWNPTDGLQKETDRKAGDETLEFATSSIHVLVKLEPSGRSGSLGRVSANLL